VGNIIAFDEGGSYSAYPFKIPGNTNRKLYVPVGGDVSKIPDLNKITEEETGLQHLADVETGGFLLRKDDASGKLAWDIRSFPVGPSAMVVTENKLLVAGFTDKIAPRDPWASIEGRENAVLWILSKHDGAKLAECQLGTLPVWNGMAVANEKVFLTLKNGQLICMGR
jgi:hypothetical protein